MGLGDLVAPGGYLILSGILDHQAERVLEAGTAAGFKAIQTARQEDWVALGSGKTNWIVNRMLIRMRYNPRLEKI